MANVELKRISGDGLFSVCVDEIEIPYVDGYFNETYKFLEHLLQLNAEQFQAYKVFLLSNDWHDKITTTIHSHYVNGYKPNELGMFCDSEDVVDLLLDTHFITDTERKSLLLYKEKYRLQVLKTQKQQQPTYIYLMKDERTELIKVGRSVNPTYRETTLQSDNPMIVLIGAWLGLQNDEKMLHEKFASKRFRGEWFALDTDDIEEIVAIFSDRDTWN